MPYGILPCDAGVWIMKKIMNGIGVAALCLGAGLLFSLLSGVRYTLSGTEGAVQVISVIMSTVYLTAFLLFPVWLGYHKKIACFVTYGILFAVVGVIGLVGFMGYGFLLGGLSSVYFLLITPFAALVEQIALSCNIYYAADRIMLILPVVVYLLTMVSYIVGTILRAHERALYYSLVRLDSRYAYRLPTIEEPQTFEERHPA